MDKHQTCMPSFKDNFSSTANAHMDFSEIANASLSITLELIDKIEKRLEAKINLLESISPIGGRKRKFNKCNHT